MSPVQPRERAEWDARLARDECSLEDALMMTLLSGSAASPYLIHRVEAAFNDQREGRRQLSESFGTGRHGNEAQAIQAELLARQVFELVNELHHQFPRGHPQHLALSRSGSRTKKTGPTAFSRAAEIMQMAEGTVVNHHTKGKSLHEGDKG